VLSTLPINDSFTTRSVRWLCVFLFVLFVLCLKQGNAQEPAVDRERYYSAVDYCRRDVWPNWPSPMNAWPSRPNPMALSLDKKILCFNGEITANMDLSPAKDLEKDGLFVVRSPGGSAQSAIELSDLLRDRHATVVVYDYCFSACAAFFLVASDQTYVLKGTLVAWHYPHSSDPSHPFCTSLTMPRDGGPKKLYRGQCNTSGDQVAYSTHPLVAQFYKDRAVSATFEAPPDTRYVRKIISSIYAESAVFRDIAWTIHPRFYPSLFKTRIVYEAYPESQSEVDEMLARQHWNIRVIYDP
jgi:hypothetical protein